jgi:nitrogen fixation/metabolism regulation signal transduction histidine kinase
MNRIIESFEQDGIQREAQLTYLEAILGNINVGIITINEQGKIELMNNQASRILGIPDIKETADLIHINPEFGKQLESMKPADHKFLEYTFNNDIQYLSIAQKTIKKKGLPYRIITFQNIQSEIDQKEIESWHRLIRILRHEIMNSVTPISSLTETILMLVEDRPGIARKLSDLDQKDIDDIRESIKTIQTRSEGLFDFVDKYREVSKIPDPNFTIIEINDLFSSVSRLFSAELEKNDIHLETVFKKKGILVLGDFQLIEQVLINLIKNSIHAVRITEEPEIVLIADKTDEHTIIKVSDNGCGIKQHEMDEIFVPFYSTREYGTGIGLSLSKEIMWRHGGMIFVKSDPGVETVFTLKF